MPKPTNPIQMAVIGAPHGIKGEVRVKTFTGDPLALGAYGPLHSMDGRPFEVLSIRPAGTVVVVRFKGVEDRSAAEGLAGTKLFIDRTALPDAGDEDDFYHADLVGLSVQDETGAAIGKVAAVLNFGGGDILDLTLGGRKGVLIPFSKAAVPEVSVSGGYVRIDSLAAGLADEDENRPDADRGRKIGTGSVDLEPKRRPRGREKAGGNR